MAAHRKSHRAQMLDTQLKLGKPCPDCGERWYEVTYRNGRAIRAVCYSKRHSAPVPTAADKTWFRRKVRAARKAVSRG